MLKIHPYSFSGAFQPIEIYGFQSIGNIGGFVDFHHRRPETSITGRGCKDHFIYLHFVFHDGNRHHLHHRGFCFFGKILIFFFIRIVGKTFRSAFHRYIISPLFYASQRIGELKGVFVR